MYQPPHFKEEELGVIQEALETAGLATLVTMGVSEMEASHVPMLYDRAPGPYGALRGHIAKPNPQWLNARADIPGLAMLLGPNAYISPSLYATKRETGKVVPTWNYVAIHAYGTVEFFDDRERLRAIVTGLTGKFESRRAEPWAVTDAPEDFVNSQLKGIVGFEMVITRLEAKWKMSQNRPAEDRPGVVEGLMAEGEDEVAGIVKERNGL